LCVALFIETSFKLFEIFAERIFAAKLVPSSKMINLGADLEAMLFENPIDLLFLAPHDIPIIRLDLFPLSADKSFVNAVAKRCFEFDVRSDLE
jgi:hypothetical protein